MAVHVSLLQSRSPSSTTACSIGSPTAVLLALLAAGGFLVGILTPPRSGVFCAARCIQYPYAEAAQFFPGDYLWMAPAILLTPVFLVLASCLHFCVPPDKKPFSLIGMFFSIAAVVVLCADYGVQLLVIQPSLAHGELEGIALWTQYNAHGLFIALADLGYLLLAVALLFTGLAMPRTPRPGPGLRWILLTAGGMALGTAAGMMVWLRTEVALPLELALITIDWLALVIVGILLSLFFRRRIRSQSRRDVVIPTE